MSNLFTTCNLWLISAVAHYESPYSKCSVRHESEPIKSCGVTTSLLASTPAFFLSDRAKPLPTQANLQRKHAEGRTAGVTRFNSHAAWQWQQFDNFWQLQRITALYVALWRPSLSIAFAILLALSLLILRSTRKLVMNDPLWKTEQYCDVMAAHRTSSAVWQRSRCP